MKRADLPTDPVSGHTTGPATRPASGIVKRSVSIAGHPTSVSLEEPFWVAFRQIAKDTGLAPAALIAKIDANRGSAGLSSAIRLFVLESYKRKADGRA